MANKKQSVVVSIRLDDVALKAVDLLVDSGLESNRSRAVSYLINSGIQASGELLHKAQLLADNVQQLRNQMIEAVKINNIEKVSELINRDASLVNARNNLGETAILMAAYYRSQEIKELLMSNGADLNLFEASAIGHTQRVKDILNESPEGIGSYSGDGFTPLGLAAHFGNEETVKLLLERGAHIDASSADGNLNNTALHAAIAGNHEHIVQLLIENGADASAKCGGIWRLGFTPLHVAAYFGRESIIEMLIQAGADKMAQTDSGDTPFHIAMTREHQGAAALLNPVS